VVCGVGGGGTVAAATTSGSGFRWAASRARDQCKLKELYGEALAKRTK
jgi:hypothetical protein